MSGTLRKLVDATHERLAAGFYDGRPAEPIEPNGSLADAIATHDPAIVAEIKPARPDGSTFAVDPAQQARSYAEGGAAGISVLTDPDHFDGSLANLREAGAAGRPLLMKDFLVDERQIQAAEAWGASAVLAIARLPREGYTDYTLKQACQDAHDRGLEILAEVVTADELEQALAAGADAIGVNVRDLDTLAIDPERTRHLLADRQLPVPALHLSDIETRADVKQAVADGAHGALVGTSLMEAEDPTQRLRALRGGHPS
jgi:indole-3-glycerol phosphate synthase